MTVLPVIERELRTQSRLGFTYLLRDLGAGALVLFCAYFYAEAGFAPQFGGVLFGALNLVLFVSIWLLVPLSCADCISRERREGTLGLLFLTPLKAREIVLSKGLVHGLRALTLWLAAAPIMTICFLIGGVTWKEAVLACLINFSSICWALAAGLLASASTKSWLRAMVFAGLIAFCFFVAFADAAGWIVRLAMRQRARGSFFFFFGSNQIGFWWRNPFAILNRAGQRDLLLTAFGTVVLSLLFLMGVIFLAAWIVRRGWQEEPPSARRVWMEETFTKPIIGVNFFHRWLRRKLERNPIGWLEQRTWSGRLVTWGWFAVMVSFYSAVFYVPNADKMLRGLQDFMAWSLLFLIAVSASGSFQRERETRVLELLLVSPMTAGQIIWGRLRGLWGQFLPAMALMLGVWAFLVTSFEGQLELIPFFCSSFLCLPVIGLYYSLRRANFISAFLSTVAVGLILPRLVTAVLNLISQLIFFGASLGEIINPLAGGPRFDILFYPNFPVFLQVVIALYLGRKLHRDLVHRNFPFSKGAT